MSVVAVTIDGNRLNVLKSIKSVKDPPLNSTGWKCCCTHVVYLVFVLISYTHGHRPQIYLP